MPPLPLYLIIMSTEEVMGKLPSVEKFYNLGCMKMHSLLLNLGWQEVTLCDFHEFSNTTR